MNKLEYFLFRMDVEKDAAIKRHPESLFETGDQYREALALVQEATTKLCDAVILSNEITEVQALSELKNLSIRRSVEKNINQDNAENTEKKD